MRSPTPTWGAARPTPGAATMVSTMSSISWRMLLSTRATRFAFWRRIGASWVRIGRTAIAFSLTSGRRRGPSPGLVSVSIGRHDQLAIRRESILRPDCTLLTEEAAVIVVAGVADCGMIGRVGLDEHL